MISIRKIEYILWIFVLLVTSETSFKINSKSNSFGDFSLGRGFDIKKFEKLQSHIFDEEEITYDIMPVVHVVTDCYTLESADQVSKKMDIHGEVSIDYKDFSFTESGFLTYDGVDEQMRRVVYLMCTIDRTLFTISMNTPDPDSEDAKSSLNPYLRDIDAKDDEDKLREEAGDFYIKSITYGRRYEIEVEVTFAKEESYNKFESMCSSETGLNILTSAVQVKLGLESGEVKDDLDVFIRSAAHGFLEPEVLTIPKAADANNTEYDPIQEFNDKVQANLDAIINDDNGFDLVAKTGLSKERLFEVVGDAFPLEFTIVQNNPYLESLTLGEECLESVLIENLDEAWDIYRQLQDYRDNVMIRAKGLFENFGLLSGITELSATLMEIRQNLVEKIDDYQNEVEEYLHQDPSDICETKIYNWAEDREEGNLDALSLFYLQTDVNELMGIDNLPMNETCAFNGIVGNVDGQKIKIAGRIVYSDKIVNHILFDMDGEPTTLGYIDHSKSYGGASTDEYMGSRHEVVYVRSDCTLFQWGSNVWYNDTRYIVVLVGSDHHVDADGIAMREKLSNIALEIHRVHGDGDNIMLIGDEIDVLSIRYEDNPTTFPSFMPSVLPTVDPTTGPTVLPTGTPSVTPTVAPTANPTKLSIIFDAGYDFTCMGFEQYSIECFGHNNQKQSEPPADQGILKFGMGYLHGCAIFVENNFVGCWGYNNHRESTPPMEVPFLDVDCGSHYSCGLRMEDNGVSCWGHNHHNLVNNKPHGEYVGITVGHLHACVMRESQYIECWGHNGHREQQVPAFKADFFEAGYHHTCLIRSDNQQGACWGYNGHGETNVPAGVKWIHLAPALYHTCGIDKDQRLRCWGHSSYRGTPPTGKFDVVKTYYRHTCAFSYDSLELECWGTNNYKQAPSNVDALTLPREEVLDLDNGTTTVDMGNGWGVGKSLCGDYGFILGGYNKIARGTMSKTYELEFEGCSVDVSLIYLAIDSWENEVAFVEVNDERKWSVTHHYNKGSGNICGAGTKDTKYEVSFTVDKVEGTEMTLTIGSQLNQAATDESMGATEITLTPHCPEPEVEEEEVSSETNVGSEMNAYEEADEESDDATAKSTLGSLPSLGRVGTIMVLIVIYAFVVTLVNCRSKIVSCCTGEYNKIGENLEI